MRQKNDPVVITVTDKPTKLAEIARQAVGKWEAIPTTPPVVDPRLTRLSATKRAAEVLRYSTRRLEHWLSPGGFLREWLRHCVQLALILIIPALLFTPVVTLILTSAVTWSAAIAEVFHNLALMAQWIGTALLWIAGIFVAIRLMTNRR